MHRHTQCHRPDVDADVDVGCADVGTVCDGIRPAAACCWRRDVSVVDADVDVGCVGSLTLRPTRYLPRN